MITANSLYTGNGRVAQRDWLAWILAITWLDDCSTRRDDVARWWCVIGWKLGRGDVACVRTCTQPVQSTRMNEWMGTISSFWWNNSCGAMFEDFEVTLSWQCSHVIILTLTYKMLWNISVLPWPKIFWPGSILFVLPVCFIFFVHDQINLLLLLLLLRIFKPEIIKRQCSRMISTSPAEKPREYT